MTGVRREIDKMGLKVATIAVEREQWPTNYNWHDSVHNSAEAIPCGNNTDVLRWPRTIGTAIGDEPRNDEWRAAAAKWIGCRNSTWIRGTAHGQICRVHAIFSRALPSRRHASSGRDPYYDELLDLSACGRLFG